LRWSKARDSSPTIICSYPFSLLPTEAMIRFHPSDIRFDTSFYLQGYGYVDLSAVRHHVYVVKD
jgi:hypothetical protein